MWVWIVDCKLQFHSLGHMAVAHHNIHFWKPSCAARASALVHAHPQHGRRSIQPNRAASSLEQWLVQHGGSVYGIELKHRTVYATERIEKRRLLVSVPQACQVRYDQVDDDEALQQLFLCVPRGSKDDSIGAWQFRQALTVSAAEGRAFSPLMLGVACAPPLHHVPFLPPASPHP